MITTFLSILVIALFSGLAFWKYSPPVFMVTAGLSMLLGLGLPDLITSQATTTTMDLTLGLAFIGYSLFCIGSAFRCMFWRGEVADED